MEITKNNSFIILVDKQLYKANGYLRSLSLIDALSNGYLKRVVTWESGHNCKNPINLLERPVEFVNPENFSPSNSLTCVYGNDEKDTELKYIDKYVEFSTPSILIINHPNFIPENWKNSGKSLESKSSILPFEFTVELNRYLESENLNNYQLPETKNLSFIELSKLHKELTSERAKNLVDLFNFEDDNLSISPIWDWLLKILTLKRENKVVNLYNFIFNAFRPHIERNMYVEEVAKTFSSFFSNSSKSYKKIQKIRENKFKKVEHEYLEFLKNSPDSKSKSFIEREMDVIKCQ